MSSAGECPGKVWEAEVSFTGEGGSPYTPFRRAQKASPHSVVAGGGPVPLCGDDEGGAPRRDRALRSPSCVPPPRLHLAPGGSRLPRGPRERGGVQPLPRGPLRTPRFPRPRGWAVRERPCPGGPGLEAGLLRSPFPVYGFGCSRVSGGEKRLRGRRWSGSLRGGVEPAEGESCREPP